MGHGPHRPYVSRRQFVQRTAAVGIAAGAGPFLWQQPGYSAATPVEQIHGQFGHDAAREAAFSWMTPGPVRRPFVQFGQERVAAETVQYPGYPGYFHHARVEDLLPDTRYRYAVGHQGTVRSTKAVWRTGPRPGKGFTFTAFGDQGTDVPDLTNIQDFDPLTLQTITHQQPPFQASVNRDLAYSMNPAFHAIVGDTSYANGDQAIWDEWFRGIEKMARSMPWMPCLGNHEIEAAGGIGGFSLTGMVTGEEPDSWGPLGYDAYRHRFALPSNGDEDWEGNWYRFRYGSVEFISIDNNDVNTEVTANIGYSEGRQKRWVERTLRRAAADRDVDFIIVLMHQAAFSSGLHGSDPGVRETWFQLFSEHGVDLVIQGHDHHYERTHLMDHDRVVESGREGVYTSDVGTMYVVSGNGGGVQRGEGMFGGGDFTAAIQAMEVGTVKVQVIPDTGEGTKRLVLGEYSAARGGAPIEEGIVIERRLDAERGRGRGAARRETAMTGAPVSESPIGPLHETTGGVAALAMGAAATAVPATAWTRGPGDDEVTELREQRRSDVRRALRDLP